jgi:hypothetical protein
MAIADLLSNRRVTITNESNLTVTLDVTLNAKHTRQNDVTESPVEDGTTKTDNVRPKPVRLVLTGVLSNAPIGFIPKILEDNIARDGFEQLEKFWKAADRLTIITPLAAYDGMVIESLESDQDNVNVAPITIAFKRIETASSRVVSVPQKPRDVKKKKLGKKPAPPAKPNVSVLARARNALTGG